MRTVLHTWSHCSCSLPSHFLCPPRQLREGEQYLPPPLTLYSVLPLAEGMCWPHVPACWPQLSLGSALSIRMTLPSEPGSGRRMLALAALPFPPMEFPSPWLPVWITWPGECRQHWLHTNDYSQEEDAGVLAACSQQKTELMTFFTSLVEWLGVWF